MLMNCVRCAVPFQCVLTVILGSNEMPKVVIADQIFEHNIETADQQVKAIEQVVSQHDVLSVICEGGIAFNQVERQNDFVHHLLFAQRYISQQKKNTSPDDSGRGLFEK